MKKYLLSHFALFGYLQFMGVFLYGFFPEAKIIPSLILAISFVYFIVDTIVYYKKIKEHIKPKQAKALSVYDRIVFLCTFFLFLFLYIYPFVWDLLYDDSPDLHAIPRLLLVLLIQIIYLVLRVICNRGTRSKDNNLEKNTQKRTQYHEKKTF
ncbi:MAG: hypothetical protein E7647_08965 [Ruminococcaceae bacterium]|nr:hypothetical protein [Oscillospiraceae bacterium]